MILIWPNYNKITQKQQKLKLLSIEKGYLGSWADNNILIRRLSTGINLRPSNLTNVSVMN